MLILELHP